MCLPALPCGRLSHMQEVSQSGVQSQGVLQGTTPASDYGCATALRTSYFPVRRVSPLQSLRQAKLKMGARPDEGGARQPAVVLQGVQNEETHVDTGVTEEAPVYKWRLFFLLLPPDSDRITSVAVCGGHVGLLLCYGECGTLCNRGFQQPYNSVRFARPICLCACTFS